MNWGTTDEEGKLVFQADLPHGKYYIQEVEHKPGYLPNDEIVMAAYGALHVSHYWSSLTRGRERQVLL